MALSLLQNYESDSSGSSDDDISVTVGITEAKKRPVVETNLDIKSHKKLKSKEKVPSRISKTDIPLPQSINAMFLDKKDEMIHDDPSLHNGRIRSFGHDKNNWASYVYIDLQDCDLDDVKDFIVREIDLEPIEHHHLSLSRVVSLRHHWIDPLSSTLKATIQREKSFHLALDKLQVYVNDEKTRTFVGIEAQVGVRELQNLTTCVDKCFADYNLAPFYNPPSFHVSLGWCLGDKSALIRGMLQKLELKLVDVLDEDGATGTLHVKDIHCKIGNKIFQFKLK